MIHMGKRLHPKFKLNKDNFHFTIISNNVFDMLQNAIDLSEWRASDLYKSLCKKLYEQGVRILNNWEHYEKLADEGYAGDYIFLKGDYRTARNRQYNVYNYVFGRGYEHFIETTKKHGHNINGTQYIYSSYEEDVYFKVIEPFTESSYFEFKTYNNI